MGQPVAAGQEERSLRWQTAPRCPAPFLVTPVIAHWEEFINKCFLSPFRNASPSVAFETLSSVKAVLCHKLGRSGAPLPLAAGRFGKEVGCNGDGVTL